MTKSMLIGILAAVVVVGGGAAAFVLTRSDDTTQNKATNTSDGNAPATDEQQPKNEQAVAETASIKDFLSAGQNKECTYSDAEAKGTMYFASGERLRMDYQSVGTEASSGSMIVTNQKQYVWSADRKEGITFAFDKNQQPNDQQSGNSVDIQKDYSFTCKSWDVDESKFTPPSDVKFQDFSALMNR